MELNTKIENYTESFERIKAFIKKDAITYRNTAFIFLAISICTVFIWVISAFFFIGAMYLFYWQYLNTKKHATLHQVTINKKEIFKEISYSRTDRKRYEFQVDTKKSFDLLKNQLKSKTAKKFEFLLVNKELFDSFNKNDSFTFILSPANDLIGHLKSQSIYLYVKSKNNKEYQAGIAQLDKSKRSKWQKIN